MSAAADDMQALVHMDVKGRQIMTKGAGVDKCIIQISGGAGVVSIIVKLHTRDESIGKIQRIVYHEC